MLFDRVITREARPLRPAQLKGVRIGLAREYFFDGLDPEVERVTGEVIAGLRAAGVEFVEAPLPGLAELISKVTAPVQLHDVVPHVKQWLAQSGARESFEDVLVRLSPDVKVLMERFGPGGPMAVSQEAYVDARDVHRPAMQRLLAEYFSQHRLSAMLFPATMTPATPIGEAETVQIAGRSVPFATAIARNITPGSTVGLPGLVIPGGLTRAGLPVGVELDGPAGADRQLLAIGLAVQAALEPMPAPQASSWTWRH